MPHHNFVFQLTDDEMPHHVTAVTKVEDQDKFTGQVAVQFQRHSGVWTAEFSARTSRKLMDFITEVTMELPPEDDQEEFDEGGEPYTENHESNFPDGGNDEDESDDGDSGTAVYNDAADQKAYEEHERAAGRPVKKLKKPGAVAKTGNPNITVEED